MLVMAVRVAVLPVTPPLFADAVSKGGGALVGDPAEAEALIWVDPKDPAGLIEAVKRANPHWVQLPFAGIENFFAAGAIDASRAWTCAKGIYGSATAEHAFALTMIAARQLQRHARTTFWIPPSNTQRRLIGTTAVIIGTGGIGESYARFAQPFGVRLLAVNRSGSPAAWAERTVAASELQDVVGDADWLVLAAAATPLTHHLIDAQVLALMKQDSWIINVARGSLIDTDALVDALRERRIGGAALDVTDPEPLPDGHPLWTMENAIITSHTANTLSMAFEELAALVERNVRHYQQGEDLEGLVDLHLGY
ncbi:MAG: D-isomer specific 2-hydroxyacid dehydrogenase family protein [Actinomycetota bacterium]